MASVQLVLHCGLTVVGSLGVPVILPPSPRLLHSHQGRPISIKQEGHYSFSCMLDLHGNNQKACVRIHQRRLQATATLLRRNPNVQPPSIPVHHPQPLGKPPRLPSPWAPPPSPILLHQRLFSPHTSYGNHQASLRSPLHVLPNHSTAITPIPCPPSCRARPSQCGQRRPPVGQPDIGGR